MFYGSDEMAFVTGSDVLPAVTRTFPSFSAAAAEAAASRLYGGIHFRFAIEDGLIGGTEMGEWTFAKFLTEKGNRSRKPHGGLSAADLLTARLDAARRTGAAQRR